MRRAKEYETFNCELCGVSKTREVKGGVLIGKRKKFCTKEHALRYGSINYGNYPLTTGK